jgi:hypothetical protein
MFSILICSVNNVYLEKIKINIRDTIGHVYEILVWDNVMDPKPITEVYNLLAARAKYPYWCFIHEDIRFQTDHWSEKLLYAFNRHSETGLIGIAGSRYKSRTPSGWSTGFLDMDYCNIFHQDKEGKTIHLYNNPQNSEFEPVVNVDGVFMAMRSEVWKTARFNEELLHGFHCYDIDFSFQVMQKWKTAVLFNIDILHFTQGGNFGNQWLADTLTWHEKFADQLPQHTSDYSIPSGVENKIARNWLYRLHTEDIDLKEKWRWVRKSNSWKDLSSWPYIGLFLFGKVFRRWGTKPKV